MSMIMSTVKQRRCGMNKALGARSDKPGATESLAVIVLTFNEGVHIERCLRSAQRVSEEIIVVDSYSTDDTVARSQWLGARVLQNHWTNYATQMNWALQNADIRSKWIMRLDADEYLDEELVRALWPALAAVSDDVGGFEVNRRIRFMGREIRHGGMAPLWVIRLWRNGQARCETRWMDEHMVLSSGRVARLPGAIVDDNLNSLTWWTQKHNLYANREAVDLLDQRYRLGLADETTIGLNCQARLKRWLKMHIYGRLPLGLRPWLYFFYRVFLRLGFLDGTRGMTFHTLQGLWYRLLVDAKVAEVERAVKVNGCELSHAVSHLLGIRLASARREPGMRTSPHDP